ncbi:hypothetical protein M422DRAFT_174834, partial [Sphaerobolus stellatus SS14]
LSMTETTPARQELKIWQQNTNRSLLAQTELINSLPVDEFDIVALQEPWLDWLGRTRASRHWEVVYPTRHRDNPRDTRAIILINKHISTNCWTDIDTEDEPTAVRTDEKPHHMMWVGDFNRHHPLWDEDRNNHLFSRANLDAAQTRIDLVVTHGMYMALPKDIPTLEALATKNYTRPDNVFCTVELEEAVMRCSALPEQRPNCTDHMPILTVLNLQVLQNTPQPRPNFRNADWEKFGTVLTTELNKYPAPANIGDTEEFCEILEHLYGSIQAAIGAAIPLTKPSPYAKRWWNSLLKAEQAKMRRLQRLAYECRFNLEDPIHEELRIQRNHYKQEIEKAKKELWEDFLERKSEILHRTFFLTPAPGAEGDITPNYSYPPEAFPFEEITNAQIGRALMKLKPFKAPGPNGIPNVVLQKNAGLLLPYLGPLYRATFALRYYPPQWKLSSTIVLRKPERPDYSAAKAYRPIALMDTIAKTLSSCVADALMFHTERLQLLPNTHFGGRPGRSTNDALQLMISFIKNNWRKGNVVSTLFLDVKAAFPSVSTKRLAHNLHRRGIPRFYVDWIQRKMEGRETVLKFDDFTSEPLAITNGCDQGCPLSVFCYLFYNADLLDVAQPQKQELAIAFMDDVNLIKAAKSFKKANLGLQDMMTRERGALEWSSQHSSAFEVDKLKLVCFSRKRKKTPARSTSKTIPLPRPTLTIDGQRISPAPHHKYLGVILDQELRFHPQAAYAQGKLTKYCIQLKRLAGVCKGMSLGDTRTLFKAVALTRGLYAADVWALPIRVKPGQKRASGAVGFANKLTSAQRMAALVAAGAMRTTATDFLHVHSDLLPMRLTINQINQCMAVRFAAVPDTHPLRKYVDEAKRYPATHRTPLQELFNAFNIDPDRMERIDPVVWKPGWSSPFNIMIAESKDAAKKDVRNNRKEVNIYTDGSEIDGGVGAAAVMYRDGRLIRKVRHYLGKTGEHTVYEAELVGMILGLEMLRRERRTVTAAIYLDNQAAIKATQKDDEVGPAQHLRREAESLYSRVITKHEGINFSLVWVPGHVGIEGNEKADSEAKAAARGEGSPTTELPQALRNPLPLSTSAVKAAYKLSIPEQHKRLLMNAGRLERIQRVDANAPATAYRRTVRSLSRRQTSILTQLRTGHNPLNHHLHRIGARETPFCAHCGTKRETVFHFIMSCEAYREQRTLLRKEIPPTLYNITNLLSHKDCIPELLKYVDQTGRFKRTLAERRRRT